MKKKISVMIVDDHSIVREGVEQILGKSPDIVLAGKASGPDDAVRILNDGGIDLAIVDITLKGSVSGLDLVKAIDERFPGVRTLVMSMHDESIYGERAMKAGARGYIMKEVASLCLTEAIRRVMGGELYISEELQKKIVSRAIRGGSDRISVDALSDREFEVFQLIGNGYSAREIADRLNLSANTVESHRNRIKAKLNMKDSAELTKNAIQWVITQSR
ncbi:MAG: response regulator transcription factor [Spirochaetes bacterium]|nr:response regulator transcription factor [Spirochaetota bacterium]